MKFHLINKRKIFISQFYREKDRAPCDDCSREPVSPDMLLTREAPREARSLQETSQVSLGSVFARCEKIWFNQSVPAEYVCVFFQELAFSYGKIEEVLLS